MKYLKDIILDAIHKYEYDPARNWDSDQRVITDSDFNKVADEIVNNLFNQDIDSFICDSSEICYKRRNGWCTEQDTNCCMNRSKPQPELSELWIKKTIFRRYLVDDSEVENIKLILEENNQNCVDFVEDEFDKNKEIEYDNEITVLPIEYHFSKH